MRRWAIPALVLLNLGLLAGLASLWVHRDGTPRAVRWSQPMAVSLALDARPPLPVMDVDLSRYVAILERPLFVPSRRPPPPPAPPKVAEVMPMVRVLAVYGALSDDGAGSGSAGLIARVDGVVRRLRVGDRIGGWAIEQVRRTEVVLAQGSERQTIAVRRGQVDDAVAGAGNAAGPVPTQADMDVSRATADALRAKNSRRIREMNAMRARSGLPPLPEP